MVGIDELPEKKPDDEETEKPTTTEPPASTEKPLTPGVGATPAAKPQRITTPAPTAKTPQTNKKVTVHKVKIKSMKQTKKAVVVTIKKDKTVTGYVVAYRKGKKGKYKTIKLKKWKKNKATIKKLKKGKYSFKVKAYRIVDGKTYYSAYSKVMKFKVKKLGKSK